jgi:hypothetical protein
MRFGQNPTDALMSAMPDKARIEFSLSDDSISSSKRRLSPSHMKRDSEESTTLKHRVIEDQLSSTSAVEHDSLPAPSLAAKVSHDSGEHNQARRRSSTETRSYALAITTAQLNLQCSDEDKTSATNANVERKTSVHLVDGAVERATQSIVTDAIETLLFDEGHTRKMYLKHEHELSKSSLPGIVPISKQLFSPPEGADITAESSKENALMSVSPTQLEAAAALMKQAIGMGTKPARPPFGNTEAK